VGFSHFLLLLLLHSDKTPGTWLWTERSCKRPRGLALKEWGSRPACFQPIFPIFSDLSFLSLPAPHPLWVCLDCILGMLLWSIADVQGLPKWQLDGNTVVCAVIPLDAFPKVFCASCIHFFKK
uniref:Uncharacterized protein n=1 Tax=Sus scrofa TaxID=9823 RepID=A0A4X1UV62_PIG